MRWVGLVFCGFFELGEGFFHDFLIWLVLGLLWVSLGSIWDWVK